MSNLENSSLGELLKQFRKRKKLTQLQLAERVGVRRESILNWERGKSFPDSTNLHEIAKVLSLKQDEKRLLFEALYGTASMLPLHNFPAPNPYFIGREEELVRLHHLLTADRQVILKQPQSIRGLGGIGKTQIAIQYAYQFLEHYHDILWISADSPETLAHSCVELAQQLRLYSREQRYAVEAVKQWLREHKSWLLILDNVEDPNLGQKLLPTTLQGAVILTTRRQVTGLEKQSVDVGPLPEHKSILFLLRRTEILPFNMQLDGAPADDVVAARTIAQTLGNLPLALDQAGAYIVETRCSLAEYLNVFQQHQTDLLKRREGQGIPTDHPDSVVTTFTLNFSKIENQIAREILKVSAFFASDDIGEEIFMRGAEELGSLLQPLHADRWLFDQAIESLLRFSLIQRDPKKKTLSIHRLVQAVLRDNMTEQERQNWIKQVVQIINSTMKIIETQSSTRPATLLAWSDYRERFLPHLESCAKWIQREQIATDEAAELLHEFAHHLCFSISRFSPKELIEASENAISMWEKVKGPYDLHIVDCLRSLIEPYLWLNRYGDAEKAEERALTIEQNSDLEALNAFHFRLKRIRGLTPPE